MESHQDLICLEDYKNYQYFLVGNEIRLGLLEQLYMAWMKT